MHQLQLAALLRPVNDTLIPLVRRGFANPLPLGLGLTVLVVPGRKSGRLYEFPLLALATPTGLVVATLRERSQWFRNVQAADHVDAWLWGARRTLFPQVCSEVDRLQVARLHFRREAIDRLDPSGPSAPTVNISRRGLWPCS